MESTVINENESSGLETLANAATIGVGTCDQGSSSVEPTTMHPKLYLGCSCFVCIQPPSEEGNHISDCTCSVCKTIRRHFRSLLVKKKKQQYQQQKSEVARRKHKKQSTKHKRKDYKPAKAGNIRSSFLDHRCESEGNLQVELSQTNYGLSNVSGKAIDQIDHPEQEEDSGAGLAQATLMDLFELNVLASLALEQEASNASEQGLVADHHPVELPNESGKTLYQNGHPEGEEDSRAGLVQATNLVELNALSSLASEQGQVADNHLVSQHKQVELSNVSGKILDKNGHPQGEADARVGPAQATMTNYLLLNNFTSLASEQGQVADNHPITQHKQWKDAYKLGNHDESYSVECCPYKLGNHDESYSVECFPYKLGIRARN